MKIISVLRCNLKRIILLLSVFHHKVHLITLVFYGFQLDIEQWGQGTVPSRNYLTVSFPVSFSNAFGMLCSARYSNLATDIWQDTYCAVISNSQGRVATSNTANTNVQWFALGKAQLQWGAASGSGEIKITLPISFASTGYIGLATPRSSASWAVILAAINKSQIQVNSPASVYWITIGK